MEILTMISAWKLLRVLNNCGQSDCIESLWYNPTDQPGLSDPLSNDPMPDSNFFIRLLTSRYMVKEETDINDQG